ncbi:hypothetical protein [Pasteurella sp. PK-2025]|uniref:hypothetical protein n=1 Tax=Pasteurella sp. PK-2025 TaxID=3413133 RepID=UPI003C78A1BF
MQKLLIVRGHSGSGKSTFALSKMAEFTQGSPHGKIFHIENDHFLMEDGVYHWTFERFLQAKEKAQQLLAQAFDFCRQYPEQDVFIVVSNVGGNTEEIRQMRAKADGLGLVTEIYRLQNFFDNTHQVEARIVHEMYLHLMNHPVEDEIFVPTLAPMTEKTRQEIEKLQAQKRKNRYTKKG